MRREMVETEQRMHFSYDLEAGLSDEERALGALLESIKRRELKDDIYNAIIHDYFDNFVSNTGPKIDSQQSLVFSD
jgi:hypothetical protein